MRARVLVVDSTLEIGDAFRFDSASRRFVTLDRLKYFNRWAFDIVAVPSACDTARLQLKSDFLDTFVRGGGILLCLHSRSGSQHQFLNCSTINGSRVEGVRVADTEEAVQILGDAESDDLMLHAGWYAHASFTCNSSCEVTPLIYATDDPDQWQSYTAAIMAPNHGKGGAVLFSTTDFDYHALHEPALPPSWDDQGSIDRKKDRAARVCHEMCDWTQREYGKWSWWKQAFRRLMGQFSFQYLIRDGLILAGLAVVAVGILYAQNIVTAQVLAIVSIAVTLATIALALYEGHNRVRR